MAAARRMICAVVVVVIVVIGGTAIAVSDTNDNARLSVGQSASPKTGTSTSPNTTTCTASISVVPRAKVPHDVAAWAEGAAVVGNGALWTRRSNIDAPGSHQGNIWRVKLSWYTRPFGLPTITGRRLDGTGTFHAHGNPATDSRGTWVVSSFEFSHPGCWQVTSRYLNSTIQFRIHILANAHPTPPSLAQPAAGSGISATPTLATTSAIGPNQHYLGYVNGKHANAVIRVVCPGPVGGNRTGPPVGKQTVTVKRVSSGGGYTGSFAHEVWAQFGKDALHVVGFTSYNTPKIIPTALRLPCSGTGTVPFTTCFGTLACASSAKDDIVHVSFENIAV